LGVRSLFPKEKPECPCHAKTGRSKRNFFFLSVPGLQKINGFLDSRFDSDIQGRLPVVVLDIGVGAAFQQNFCPFL